MYLVGADHPHKAAAQRTVERLVTARERLVTDAEAFQEVLHRYSAIRRLDAVQPAFDALRSLVDEVFPITLAEALSAKDLLLGHKGLAARDAVHLAVMNAHAITRIFTYDRGFDIIPGLQRLT